jgi:hypothetical protein
MLHADNLVFVAAVVNMIFFTALSNTVAYIEGVPKTWPDWKRNWILVADGVMNSIVLRLRSSEIDQIIEIQSL